MEKNIIKQQYLEGDEYYSNKTNKKTIVLHHTAGSHRPDWVIKVSFSLTLIVKYLKKM